MKTGIALSLAAIGALGGTGILQNVHVPFISDGYQPPAECVAWYDGCNMCQKGPDGIAVCTARVCANPGNGFCRETASSTPQSA